MTVILVMTASALHRHFFGARRLDVAIGTLQLAVCAQKRKMSLLPMIEFPQRPSVGRVTALTFLAKAAFVHVVVRMTFDTGFRRSAEGERRMALGTADDTMQP